MYLEVFKHKTRNANAQVLWFCHNDFEILKNLLKKNKNWISMLNSISFSKIFFPQFSLKRSIIVISTKTEGLFLNLEAYSKRLITLLRQGN